METIITIELRSEPKTIIIKPSVNFEPFEKAKGETLNNVQKLILHAAHTPKKQIIEKAVMTDLEGEEVVIFKFNKEKKRKHEHSNN